MFVRYIHVWKVDLYSVGRTYHAYVLYSSTPRQKAIIFVWNESSLRSYFFYHLFVPWILYTACWLDLRCSYSLVYLKYFVIDNISPIYMWKPIYWLRHEIYSIVMVSLFHGKFVICFHGLLVHCPNQLKCRKYKTFFLMFFLDVYKLVNIVNRSRPRLTSCLLKKQARHQCDVCTPSSDCLVVCNQFVTLKKLIVNKFLRSR